MNKLEACPFCGYEAVIEEISARKGFEFIVHCNGCLASMGTITYDTKEEAFAEAIAAWNRRANDWVNVEEGK